MNGFANTLLSFILSWIRTLINNLWGIVTSEDGGLLYQFFAQNWHVLVLILLIAGLLIDRLVYFFRWRPDYVWRSRLRRLRSRRQKPEPAETVDQEHPEPVSFEPTAAYQPAAAPTMAYAPLKMSGGAPAEVYTQIYAPAQTDEPVFDEPVAQWEEPDDWQQGTLVGFGQPRPEPLTYYHDMQAGFAPAIPPEQLYAPRTRSRMPEAQPAPVHPGLDAETFRQSVGLQEQSPGPVPVMRAPAFRPFTAMKEDAEPVRPQSALSRLAKRARTLVGVEDEDQPLTIRDLHSTVDVSKAFHEPVYPQNMKIDE